MKLLLTLLLLVTLPSYTWAVGGSKRSFYKEAVVYHSNVAAVVKKLKNNLEKSGDTVRILKFSDVVKEQGGKDFPEYTILLGCNSDKNTAVIHHDPALGNLLPCSIVVFDAGKGKVKVNLADSNRFAEVVHASTEGREFVNHTYAHLLKTLKLKFKSGKPSELGEIFQTREAGDQNTILPEFNALLISFLQGENLNVIFSADSGKDMTTHFVCSAGIGNIILKTMPEFGVFAPCRLIIIKGESKVQIGLLNIKEVIQSNKKRVGKEGMEAAEKLNESVSNALDMVTGN